MDKPTALGAHIYAGGHTVGVRQAGFDAPVHLEEWTFGVETAKRNLGVEVRVGPENWRPREFQGLVNWLYSNPPCAAFSVAGVKNGARKAAGANVDRWRADARMQHTLRCFDLVDEVEPDVFSWECVAQAEKAHEFQADRVRFCHERGYDAHCLLLDVADCGLPSRRRRFFFVASRLEFDARRPCSPRSCPREAWAGLDPGPLLPGSKTNIAVLRTMPPGRGDLAEHWTRVNCGTKRQEHDTGGAIAHGRPGFVNKRLGWDEPAFTVAGGQHLFHPDECRPITPAEQAALLGYPRGYEFVGAPSSQYAQIGKAVTPPAGRWLGEQVMRAVTAPHPVVGRRPMAIKWDFLKTGGDGEPVEWDLT